MLQSQARTVTGAGMGRAAAVQRLFARTVAQFGCVDVLLHAVMATAMPFAGRS